MQFLTESVVITFLWGFVAIVFSYSVVYGINFIIASMWSWATAGPISIHLSITSDVVILAFTLTALTGIWFGILPAQKAVKLKTIDALRFE
jgi:ABC-type antimicrobial peptide transport system permease subunit